MLSLFLDPSLCCVCQVELTLKFAIYEINCVRFIQYIQTSTSLKVITRTVLVQNYDFSSSVFKQGPGYYKAHCFIISLVQNNVTGTRVTDVNLVIKKCVLIFLFMVI